jgi:hypothetical protein
MMIEHDGRDIPFEIRGPSQEKEERFFYAVVDFLLAIEGKFGAAVIWRAAFTRIVAVWR